jgi:hypothetical protein
MHEFQSSSVKATLVVVAIVVGITSLVSAQIRTVVFNELMWMGSSAGSSDEWIELRNTTDSPIALSGWQIRKGDESVMLTIAEGKVIPGYGVFLISNYANNDTNSVLQAEPDLVDTDVSLVNSKLQLKLYAIEGVDTVLVDVADDSTGTPLAGSNEDPKASMVRRYCADPDSFPKAGDGTLASSWFTATFSAGWDSGATEKGTPGFPEPATVRVSCDSTVVLRDTLTVSIIIEDVVDLFEANVGIIFDSLVVKYLSVDSTSHKEFLGENSVMLTNVFSDSINIAVSRLGQIGGVSGSGTLATIDFEAVGNDSSSTDFSLRGVKLRSYSNLDSLLVTTVKDSVTVVTLKVTDTSPADGAVNVITTAPTRATFDNEPITGVDNTRFCIEGILGTATYDSTTKTAAFNPDSCLSADKGYTAVLDSSLGMTANYTWSFTTSTVGDIFDLDDPTDQDPGDDYIADGLVDGDDLAVLGFFWGSTPAGSYWSFLPDFNKDDQIDWDDLNILAAHYGNKSANFGSSPKVVARSSSAEADDGSMPVLRLIYDRGEIFKGEEFDVVVKVEQAVDLYALNFNLQYDGEMFGLLKAEEGSFWGDAATMALVTKSMEGQIIVGATRLGRIGGVSGEGFIAELLFKAKKDGIANLTLSNVILVNSGLELIHAHMTNTAVVTEEETAFSFSLGVALFQNYPNPFNPPTLISYILPKPAVVSLKIYDLLGQEVRVLAAGLQPAGFHKLSWDGKNRYGENVGNGVYLLNLKASGCSSVKKLVLLR